LKKDVQKTANNKFKNYVINILIIIWLNKLSFLKNCLFKCKKKFMPKTIISILILLRMKSDLRSKPSISQLHIALPLSYQTVSRSNLTLNIPPKMIDSINIENLTLHGLCNSTLLDICESNLIVGTLTWRETKYQCTPDQEMFVRETGK